MRLDQFGLTFTHSRCKKINRCVKKNLHLHLWDIQQTLKSDFRTFFTFKRQLQLSVKDVLSFR